MIIINLLKCNTIIVYVEKRQSSHAYNIHISYTDYRSLANHRYIISYYYLRQSLAINSYSCCSEIIDFFLRWSIECNIIYQLPFLLFVARADNVFRL